MKENIPDRLCHRLASASCFTDVSKYDCKPSVLKSALYCRSKYPQTTAVELYLTCMFDYCPDGLVQQWVMGHYASTHVTHPKKWPIWPINPWPIDPLPALHVIGALWFFRDDDNDDDLSDCRRCFFAEKSSSGLQKAILQLSHILRNEQKILKM